MVIRAAAVLCATFTATASASGAATADPALCEASVSLDPARAVPGQQVRWRLRLLVRSNVDEVAWEEPPAFPGLRAERLVAPDDAPPVERGGAIYHVRGDARALFAERPGRTAIPGARLLCRAREDDGERSESIATPGSTLDVIGIPDAGTGARSGGLVGPLAIRRSATPDRVALGRSVRVAVTLEGEGNLWDAREPELSHEALGDVEIFRRPAELELDRGPRLRVRRRFAIDLVPRREGVLRIPAFAWSYFDPTTGRHAEAVAEAIDVVVDPPPPASRESASASKASGPETPGAEANGENAQAPASLARWLVAAVLSLLGATGILGWRALRRRRAVAKAVAQALEQANAARVAGDRDGELAGLARALRAALAPELGAAAEEPPGAIPAAGASEWARTTAELVGQLERARFDPTAPEPDRAAILRALLVRAHRTQGGRGPLS